MEVFYRDTKLINGVLISCIKPGLHAVLMDVKPGFHLQQTLQPRHKKQSDYVVDQSSFPLIALF